MKVTYISNFRKFKDQNLSVALGFFDGFHLGHMSLFNKALENNKHVGMMTFDISPKNYLNHNQGWPSLLSLSDKADFLEKIGFDYFMSQWLSINQITWNLIFNWSNAFCFIREPPYNIKYLIVNVLQKRYHEKSWYHTHPCQ